MQIEIKIDPTAVEPKILILTDHMTDEISSLVQRISEGSPQILTGFQGQRLQILEQADILRIYASQGKVFAVTEQGEYTLRQRLYTLEERLCKNSFSRISNSEIVNLKKVRYFDLSLSGTVRVTLSNGDVTYVSRRYITKIKQVLGI